MKLWIRIRNPDPQLEKMLYPDPYPDPHSTLAPGSRLGGVAAVGAAWRPGGRLSFQRVQVSTETVVIFKFWRSSGIDSASLCSLAGRYDNPLPTRFLALIDRSKIPAQKRGPSQGFSITSRFLAPIDCSKIPAQKRGPIRVFLFLLGS